MTAAEYAEHVKTELAGTWLPRIDEHIENEDWFVRFWGITRKPRGDSAHSPRSRVESRPAPPALPGPWDNPYLSVFARAGCEEVAVPYDITRVSLFADELESSWHRMLLLADHEAAQRTDSLRLEFMAC